MVTGHISVKDANGNDLGQMYPAKWYFRKHEDQPTSEVAIRRIVRGRPLHRDAGLRDAGADGERRGPRQPAGELDLGRLRHSRDRHGHRAAAGHGVQLRRGPRPRRCGHDVAAAARAAARRRLLGLRAEDRPAGRAQRAQRDLEDNIMCQCSCHQPMGSCQMRPNCGHYDEQKAKIADVPRRRARTATACSRRSSRSTAGRMCSPRRSIAASIGSRGSCRTRSGVIGLVLAGLLAVRWSRRAADQQMAVAGGGERATTRRSTPG